MQRIKYILFIIMVLSFTKVKALNITVGMECNEYTLQKAENTKCEIRANIPSGITINNFSLDITKDPDLTVSFDEGQGWSGNLSGNRLVLTNLEGVSGNNTVGRLTVSVSPSASFGSKELNMINIDLSSTDGLIYSKASSVFQIINVLSTDNNLKDIKIDGVSIANFNSNILVYNLTINSEKINVTATLNDDLASLTGDKEYNLNYGNNVIEIKVISQSKESKIYKLNITRNDTRDKENTLRTLSLEGYNLVFDKNKLNYVVNVDANVSEVVIKSNLTSNKASYVEAYGNRTVSLDYGENIIEVKVQAENEDIKTYTLTVNREDNRSEQAILQSLSINGININLQDNVFNYNMTLKFKYNQTNVLATAYSNATIDYLDIPLEVGNNLLTIKVISEKGNENEYQININRLSQEESRVSIENIIVSNYDLAFSKDKTSYELKINKNINQLDIKILPEEEEIISSIRGNEHLKNNSLITINIKDDFNEYVYTIKIIKDENNLILGFLTIDQLCYIVFTIGVLIFIGSLIYLLKRKR